MSEGRPAKAKETAKPPIAMSKGRFEAFSDGVFAIAITLLVLELRPPDLATPSDRDLARALLLLWPDYLVYFASFATIGIMWFNHYALFHHAKHISYGTLVANLVLLLLVSFVPFVTLLLDRFGITRVPVVFYGATLVALSIVFGILSYEVMRQPGEAHSVTDFIRTRTAWNTVGPVMYVAGTLIAYFSPLVGVIVFCALAFYYLLPRTVRGALAMSERSERAADDLR